MAKSLQRIEARKLRGKGKSVRDIASALNVSKGAVSLWTRDIILSEEQIGHLFVKMKRGAAIGRAKSAILHKEKRETIFKNAIVKGIDKLSAMTDREFLIAGIALYWGEGCKKKHGVEFCNSDPRMVKFFIDWLRYSFSVPIESIYCRVGINIIHKDRDEMVKKYWSNASGIPLNQFSKTTLKLVNNKKVYENFDQHFGTLTVRVVKPGLLYANILGLIEGLYIDQQEKINLAR